MLNSVSRSSIFNEFSPEEQEYFFGIKEKAVSHHIDTLYYSVFLLDDEPEIKNPNLIDFLSRLADLKVLKQSDQASDITMCGLEVKPFGASISAGMYSYHLAYGEDFDIFISHYIPNKQHLVLDGPGWTFFVKEHDKEDKEDLRVFLLLQIEHDAYHNSICASFQIQSSKSLSPEEERPSEPFP